MIARTNGTFIFFDEVCYKISDISKMYIDKNYSRYEFTINIIVRDINEVVWESTEQDIDAEYIELTELLYNATNTLPQEIKRNSTMVKLLNF